MYELKKYHGDRVMSLTYDDENQSFSSYVIQASKHRIFNGFRKKVNEQAYLDFLIYKIHFTPVSFSDKSQSFFDTSLSFACGSSLCAPTGPVQLLRPVGP